MEHSPHSTPAGRGDRGRLYSEEAERCLLGTILLDPDKTLDFCIEKQVETESFYLRAHRTIYDAMLDMAREGKPVDALTLSNKLSAQGKLDEIGGTIYLGQLTEAVPTTAHAEFYVDIVRQNHLLRRIIECAGNAVNECYSSDGDADMVLGRVEQSFFEISDQRHNLMVPWQHAVKETMKTIEHLRTNKRDVSGIATGFRDIDRQLLGLHSGEMIVLAARPSMGKTSLAMNIAENVAAGSAEEKPRAVGIFSLEMTREQLIMRMLGSRARISTHKIASGYLTPANHGLLAQAADALMKAPIYLDDTGDLDIIELRARARRMKKKHDIELFIIDYLQLLHCKESRKEGRQLETSAISGSIKGMAKELKVPVLVLSQLNRAPEAKDREGKPRLADLRDSGSIEQDADVVCLLRRPSRYRDSDKNEGADAEEGLALVDVAKQRNGPTGEIKLVFLEELMRFENHAAGAHMGEESTSFANGNDL